MGKPARIPASIIAALVAFGAQGCQRASYFTPMPTSGSGSPPRTDLVSAGGTGDGTPVEGRSYYFYVDAARPCADLGPDGKPLPNSEIAVTNLSGVLSAQLIRSDCSNLVTPQPLNASDLQFATDGSGSLIYHGVTFVPGTGPAPNLLRGTADFSCPLWSPYGAGNPPVLNPQASTITWPGGAFASLRQSYLFQPNTTYTMTWKVSSATATPFALTYYDGTTNHPSQDFIASSTLTFYSYTFTTSSTITPGPVATGPVIAISTATSNTAGTLTIGQPKLELGSSFTGADDVPCQ